jgi:single-stranded-DNA-specific exonuclease
MDTPADLAWRLDPCWCRSTDPYLIHGMAAAVAAVREAVAAGRRICVYGDYDVDGVTATALLVRVLQRLGAQVDFFIPNRFSDGYGLSLDCIREVQETRSPALLISVDCGVRSLEEVAASRELGMDWVITDHHALGPELPPALAVVHPGLGGYENPGLAGVGVAFKLAQALLDAVPVPKGEITTFLDGLLKLVALGTLADMVPLRGENALLARRGLLALGSGNGPGLSLLLRAARVEGQVKSQDVAFGLAPRLNAVGRMGGAEDAVRLLLTRDPVEARALMDRVERLNSERRLVQQELVERLPAPDGSAFDLVVDPEAHKGVIGIVAGRRMRAAGRPSAVCTVHEGVAQCSMRAPEGYDLGSLLDLARPFLLSGGGHRSAAGMSFLMGRLPFVRQVLERGALEQAEALPPSDLLVDGVRPEEVPEEAALMALEPFGQGFAPPLFLLEGTLAQDPAPFGQGHAKLRIQGVPDALTWFSSQPRTAALKRGDWLAFAATPQDHPRWGRSWLVECPVMPSSQEASA